jgi:hypothetical protein
LAHATSLIGVCFGSINSKTSDGYTFHFRCQALPGFREVGQNEDSANANSHRDRSFDNVEPALTTLVDAQLGMNIFAYHFQAASPRWPSKPLRIPAAMREPKAPDTSEPA